MLKSRAVDAGAASVGGVCGAEYREAVMDGIRDGLANGVLLAAVVLLLVAGSCMWIGMGVRS